MPINQRKAALRGPLFAITKAHEIQAEREEEIRLAEKREKSSLRHTELLKTKIEDDDEAREKLWDSRRGKLIKERDACMYLNKRRSAKGTVSGWYLNPESHIPFWTARKVHAYRRLNRKSAITKQQRETYNQLKNGRISTDFHLTTGEMQYLHSLAKPVEFLAEEKGDQKPVISSELQQILKDLQQQAEKDEEGRGDEAVKPDEEARVWRERERDAERRNKRLFREMEKEGDGEVWQAPGEDSLFVW